MRITPRATSYAWKTHRSPTRQGTTGQRRKLPTRRPGYAEDAQGTSRGK